MQRAASGVIFGVGTALRRYRPALALTPHWVALREAKTALEQAARR